MVAFPFALHDFAMSVLTYARVAWIWINYVCFECYSHMGAFDELSNTVALQVFAGRNFTNFKLQKPYPIHRYPP